MISFKNDEFKRLYDKLPNHVQAAADRQYARWQSNPSHPSLKFKKVGPYWSVRVTDDYRALAVRDGRDFVWFWIGPHAEYDKILKQ